MTESKHTPGPWSVTGPPEVMVIRPSDGSRIIAFLGSYLDPDVGRDTAALIARAPDLLREVEDLRAQNAELLEALVAARKAWVYEASQGDGIMIEHDRIIDAADTAIAKAK